MNINDAANVAALLDQLKDSPQWQEIAAGITASPPQAKPTEITNESVASLLSQLEFPAANGTDSAPMLADRGKSRTQLENSPRNISFREALPILSELSESESFLSGINKIKNDQNSLERDLWAEREAIYTKYHERFKTIKTKAQIMGASVSQHEIDTMTEAFNKDIHKFDNGRALSAWDALISKQQQELERMKVPVMFCTTAVQDRERQQQIIQVLETLKTVSG